MDPYSLQIKLNSATCTNHSSTLTALPQSVPGKSALGCSMNAGAMIRILSKVNSHPRDTGPPG